jgi:hypothetical protein
MLLSALPKLRSLLRYCATAHVMNDDTPKSQCHQCSCNDKWSIAPYLQNILFCFVLHFSFHMGCIDL